MTKKLVGLFASVALLGSGMALADDKSKDQQTQQQQPGGDALGGSGTTQGQPDPMQGQMSDKQVTGTVVKSSSKLLHLRTDNGILPLKVDSSTQFQDPTLKGVKDLKEGQQVRASFNIKGTDNVAKSISLDAGTGGSMMEDQGINQPADSGGSGMDDQDINKDMGGSGEESGKTY